MTSRAILIERLGPPRVLVEREVDLPAPDRGEVHLRVEACGVNFADLMMRLGLYGTVPPRPFSPGFEVAGEIRSVGSGVSGWKPGDRVLALMRYGGYARDVIVSAENLFAWPGTLSAAEAAAIPVVFLTAWMCLFRAGAARAGERALILGAGGGVGTAAVQLAVRAGLEVIGTAGNERKRAFVTRELRARVCFASGGDWESEVCNLVGERQIDLALDPVGGAATVACRRLLAPCGRLIFYGLSQAAPGRQRNWLQAAMAWLRTPRFHPLDLIRPNIGIHGVHLLHLGTREGFLREAYAELLPALVNRELFPVLDQIFPLTREGAVDAHSYLHARGNLGKVVLVAPA